MISLSPFAPGFVPLLLPDEGEPSGKRRSTLDDLDHALRRANDEAIAAARAGDSCAAERHREMASYYSIRALELIEKRDANSVPMLQSVAI